MLGTIELFNHSQLLAEVYLNCECTHYVTDNVTKAQTVAIYNTSLGTVFMSTSPMTGSYSTACYITTEN